MVTELENHDEVESMYQASFRQLSSVAADLGIPQDEADDLIHTVLLGSLHLPRPDPERWLTAALTAAAEEKKGER